jgi:hypothetical protein
VRLLGGVIVFLVPFAVAADKKTGPAKAGNDAVDIVATVASGKEAAAKLLGIDPGMELIVVDVKLAPKTDEKMRVSRDDFTLISRRDGQRSQAMHPSQIAGSSSLMVSSRGPGSSGGMVNQNRGPIWGGMPGTGGRPRRIGGDDEAVGPVDPGETKATITKNKDEESPLLTALRQKELPLAGSAEPVSGLIYFIFEGKHKVKDLELMYKGPGGTLMLDFEK